MRHVLSPSLAVFVQVLPSLRTAMHRAAEYGLDQPTLEPARSMGGDAIRYCVSFSATGDVIMVSMGDGISAPLGEGFVNCICVTRSER